jgi:hypothetical protein
LRNGCGRLFRSLFLGSEENGLDKTFRNSRRANLEVHLLTSITENERFDLFFQLLDFLSQPRGNLAQRMTFALKPRKVFTMLP